MTGAALFLTGTGFLGSLTTFSTWLVDSERLGARGRRTAAAGNVVLSLAAGLAACGAGWGLGAAL